MTGDKVLLALQRFRLIVHTQAGKSSFRLQVRSGRMTGDEEWYEAQALGEYRGFIEEFARSLAGRE